MNSTSSSAAPRFDELVRPAQLENMVKDLYPTGGSLEWGIRQHKREYIAGGALFEIAGRLLVHPQAFRRVTLEIGNRKLAARHSVAPEPGV